MLAKILQKIYKAVLLSLGVVSGIAVAETFSEVNVTIPQDINTSFIGIYANSALYPMPKQPLFSTADMILYPERYDTLSMGITLTPPVVVNNSMKIRELFYGKPFVEFIALKDSGISRFEMSEISPELSGSLVQSGDALTLENISKNLSEECRNLYTKTFSINDQNVTYFGCSSRNADFYVIVQNDDEHIGQTYMYANEAVKPKNGESDPAENRKVLIINYLSRELVNYKHPEKTLSGLVIPEAAINVYLSSSFSRRNAEGQAEDMNESLASDFDVLHSRAEDILKDTLFNTKLLIPSRKNNFKPLQINGESATVPLSLVNVTENRFGNNLLTFSDAQGEHVAATTMITPKLMGAEDMIQIAAKIAEDKTCMAPHEINEKELMGLPSVIVDCDSTYGTEEITKSYLMLKVQSLMPDSEETDEDSDNMDSVMLILLLGDNTDNEIEDFISAGLLYNNLRWTPSLRNLTELEKSFISAVPGIKNWFNMKPEEQDEESWEKFLTETEKALAEHGDASPEDQLELIRQYSSLLAKKKKK